MAILEPSMTSRLRRMSESHVFDINDWKTRMADLQGIMSAAKALFLLLETHHEAIVRVALELALEPEVMRIFAWENWYQESQRRESFRKKVQEKLQRVFRMLEVRVPDSRAVAVAGAVSLPVKEESLEATRSPHHRRVVEQREKGVQAEDGELQRLEAQLQAMLKEREEHRDALEKLQEVQKQFLQQQQEVEHLQQAQKQLEEQQREVERLKQVEKRLEEREQEVQKLQKVQKQSKEQSGELERLREVQKAFNQQNAEMARLRQEHAAATSQVERLQAEHSQMKEEILQKNAAMKEMQTKLQGMVRDSEEAGAEAVVKRLMNKVGLTDEVVRSEKVWVRLYRDAMERLQRMAARREKREEARKEREAREAEHEPGFEEAFGDLLAGSPHSPLSAWLSPKHGTPSEQSWTPKASRSPKRLAFLEPESSSIQILQAPSRRVRKLQNSRSAPAIARCS